MLHFQSPTSQHRNETNRRINLRLQLRMSASRNPPTNPQICRLLRCTPNELRHLKQSFKSALLAQTVHGCPVLGQLPSASDPDGSLRADLWEVIGQSDAVLGAILKGERWAPGPLPQGWKERVKRVREKIFWDLNTSVRRKRRIEDVAAPTESEDEVEDVVRRRRRVKNPRTGSGKKARRRVVDESSQEGDSGSGEGVLAKRSSPRGSSVGSAGLFNGESSDAASEADAGAASDGLPELPTSGRQKTLSADAAPQSDVAEITRSEFVESTAPVTTLPRAVRRIKELEARVEALEERIQDQNDRAEGRVLRSVRGMLAERDRTIERLRFYLEGDG